MIKCPSVRRYKILNYMPLIKYKKLRELLNFAIPLIIMPISIIFMHYINLDYAIYIFIMFVLCDIYFISGYERKNIGVRRLIVCAIMISICIVGRFIPLFNPIACITILTAINLGAESGFLVGSMSILLSNFFYGQGPYTPFQMFAFGFIGFIAGHIGQILKNNYFALILYSIFSGILYSNIMDIWTVLWYNDTFDLSLYIKALYTAIPFTILYSTSNLFFILILNKPFSHKFDRIKLKYGI